MSKKNLPNIPIYIGDWERDCNVLSLESEMAWMKIIFKMHLLGKQSSYKTSTKGLQILWKSTPEKVLEILDELRFNDICEIADLSGGYEFLSRRLKKENELSEIRSEAVGKRYKKSKKEESNEYKTPTKHLQNTDIDYDNDNENKDEKEKESVREKTITKTTKPKTDVVIEIQFPFFTENFKVQWQLWKVYKSKEHKFGYKTPISEQASLNELHKLSGGNEKNAIEIIHQSMAKGWKGFFELKNNDNGNRSYSNEQSNAELKSDINSTVDRMFGD